MKRRRKYIGWKQLMVGWTLWMLLLLGEGGRGGIEACVVNSVTCSDCGVRPDGKPTGVVETAYTFQAVLANDGCAVQKSRWQVINQLTKEIVHDTGNLNGIDLTFSYTFSTSGVYEVKSIFTHSQTILFSGRIQDVTITAAPYTVTVIPSAGGTVIGPTGQDDAITCAGTTDPNSSLCRETYDGAQAMSLKAIPDDGWGFLGWDIAESSVQQAGISAGQMRSSNPPLSGERVQGKFVKMGFYEDSAQRYGFDAFSYAHLSLPEWQRAPWKSVEIQQIEPVGVDIQSSDGTLTIDQLSFSVEPQYAGESECVSVVISGEQQIKLGGRAERQCHVHAHAQHDPDAMLGTMVAAVYKQKTHTVGIRSVTLTPPGYTLNSDELKEFLNLTVYNQGVSYWEKVECLEPIVLPYDSDGDNCVDATDLDTGEAKFIRDNAGDPRFPTMVFLVNCVKDKEDPRDLLGRAKVWGRAAFVERGSGDLLTYLVIAHELGHAEFGFLHDLDDLGVEDQENVMHHQVEIAGGIIQIPTKLRFKQWERIHNLP